MSERVGPTASSAATGWFRRGLGSTWERLAPLSVGAVVSGAVIVGAGVGLRALLGSRFSRVFGWVGAAMLAPIGYWWWTQKGADESASGEVSEVLQSDAMPTDLEAKEAD